MKLLLRADVDGVGKRGDLVDVADGYARNYLVPKGFALVATPGMEAQADQMRRARMLKDAADRSAAEEIAKVLVPSVISVSAKSGPEGRLFGSVTAVDIVKAVEAQTGIEIDRKALDLTEPIKATGSHSVPTRLHADVQFQITVEVVSA